MIPIVVGVTGHRDLREKDVPKLRETVCAALKQLKEAYPHSPFVMLNSLAAGADLLCAEVAVKLGMALKCPLPMDVGEYRHDFRGGQLAQFERMRAAADSVFVAPATEAAPQPVTRDFCYRQAGIYVAAHSHVLLALWDGSPAQPGGCGTAETVDFMCKGSYEGGGFHARNDGALIHIQTPRESGGNDCPIAARLIENETGSLRNVLCTTDAFNADLHSITNTEEKKSTDQLLPEEWIQGERLESLHSLYQIADLLSLRFQKKYLRAMKWFSAFGVFLVLAFLLYDELEANLFLLCYGVLIVIYIFAFMLARKSSCHMKYLQYRVLSEALRVQFYLRTAGIQKNIGNAFTWTQKQDSTWVKEALSALLIGPAEKADIPAEIIKTYWIDGQRNYHQAALKRNLHKHRINERTARVMLIGTVALFAAVLVLELVFDSAVTQSIFTKPLPAFFMPHGEQAFTLRSLLKILLGGISAMTLFLSNYYGKLSFTRKSIGHEKMALLYAAAREQYESGQVRTEKLFWELAREEIVENGDWFSYCRENSPSFNV